MVDEGRSTYGFDKAYCRFCWNELVGVHFAGR